MFVYVPDSQAVVPGFAHALDELLYTIDVWRRFYKFLKGYLWERREEKGRLEGDIPYAVCLSCSS